MTTPNLKNRRRISINITEEEFRALSIAAVGLSVSGEYDTSRTEVVRHLIRLVAEDAKVHDALSESFIGDQVSVTCATWEGGTSRLHRKLPLGDDWKCPVPEWYRVREDGIPAETNLGGVPGSRVGGVPGSRVGGVPGSRVGGVPGSR